MSWSPSRLSKTLSPPVERSPSFMADLGGGSPFVKSVKLGEDGKERALLVSRGAGRWLCLLVTVIVIGSCGAWFTHERSLKRKAETRRLERLIRDTGERVQTLRRVSDRLDTATESSEVKAKLAEELKLGSEVHAAQEKHARAQAAMMQRGDMPSGKHAKAAERAAKAVPADMQRAMLAEFRVKAQFLVWSTTAEREQAWRASPHFGKAPSSAVESALEETEESTADGKLDTGTLVAWLRGNISAGNYPPPVNVLGGIGGYLEALTDSNDAEQGLFLSYAQQKQAYN